MSLNDSPQLIPGSAGEPSGGSRAQGKVTSSSFLQEDTFAIAVKSFYAGPSKRDPFSWSSWR